MPPLARRLVFVCNYRSGGQAILLLLLLTSPARSLNFV